MLLKVESFLSCNLKDLFLAKSITRPEYIRIHSKSFSRDVRVLYNIDDIIAKNGCVYMNIPKGMYVLKQADIISYR